MYMDPIFVVKRQCDSVKKLGLLLFLDEVVRYADVRERLRECMIGMIKREREGKSVDRHSFGKTCEMLLVLGLESRSVYEEDFEKVFLLESAKFYALRGQEYMKTKTVFGYLTKVEQHIAEEAERAKHYLDESTVVSVIEVVRNELFGNLLKAIEDMNDMDVDDMVKSRMDTEDLTRVFWLLKYVPGGVKTLLISVTKHVRCLATPALKNDEDSVSMIPKVTDLKKLFDHFPLQFFKNEHLAKQTKATDVAYILSWPSLASKLPMHLWVFVDDIIQQGVKNMTKQEIDELLDKIIERFCCVQEKDRFKQNLEKQFLFNKTTADEQEMNMVATGKSGHLAPSRIEEMVRNMRISHDMMHEFKKTCKMNLDGVQICALVLVTCFWHTVMQPFRWRIRWLLNIPAAQLGKDGRLTTQTRAITTRRPHEHHVLPARKGDVYGHVYWRASVPNVDLSDNHTLDVRADCVQQTVPGIALRYSLTDEYSKNKPGSSTE
ncbi:hypothetical protein HPB51_029687 [Rhipicephalus microplus]|uniref:Cullin family profile domain-containing protein n=1 Tax=Rhipicephalus microplus TaxID=6941 RepID=A0A9J6CTD2_RHIMP|nr:hypothetical protein HPB51_029687 [Rhipicephalus microplus]